MGKTRRRVTFLVLSLEAIGLGMFCVAIYLAGEQTLTCERASASTSAVVADGPSELACVAESRRVLWLLRFDRREIPAVRSVAAVPPAVGRSDHWLALDTPDGQVRVLPGSARKTAGDVERLQQLIDGGSDSAPTSLTLSRSLALPALAAAVFGCLWILVISLIMREFLGYHTPWWWRAINRR